MPETAQLPLSWQGSAVSRPTVSDSLPDEVIHCLENARFLHLATCTSNIPHVSLMNYTYLPQESHIQLRRPGSLPTSPTIIMTSNPSSKKTQNLTSNPNVSLLVHDWVSHRPSTLSTSDTRDRSPVGARTGSSSLANMLMQMNSESISSISCSINGEAIVLPAGSEEEAWCKQQHLANNTFEGQQGGDAPLSEGLFGTSPLAQTRSLGDGGRGTFIEDEDVRVVVVRIRDGRISDWKGQVKDWVIGSVAAGSEMPLTNGVRESA
ncbi:hypothetical protein K431DRAFT_275526 [Polychaeton citri CBS 116435]|uniref:Pyridoxamine 5'-phosphate oxidase N-terminal domain-containing protein n=1 Tax=Polychaeton citri CBS 116435 TaxID=1314669 RepID=A0A9P4Q504_9PEZI|nr:hypothetical protein K431DRAFT_275526 [Polychaeton citri CBS 116435]